MASFFQPSGSSGDPVIAACNTSLKERQVYCNRPIPYHDRLQTPLQRFTLSFSILCLVIPFVVLVSRTWRRWRKVRGEGGGNRAHRNTTSFQGRSNHSVFSAAIDLKPLASIRVLHFLDRSSDVTAVRDKNAAYAVPLPSFADPESSYPPLLRSPEPGRMILGIVEAGTLSKPAMPVWANFLFNLVQKDKLISAIVLRVDGLTPDDDRLALLDDLVARLYNRAVPVILSCHHDSSGIDLVDFGFAGGVIVENACILSDGSRRDYFRSARLRQIMTRCAEQRRERPGFLVGFHDVWEQRPSAAVVCRALKLARHFEAVYGHGPKQAGQDFHGVQDVAQTISGFEFLRRPETCELQKIWLQQKRKVHTGPHSASDQDKVACLALVELKELLPRIEHQLMPLPLPEALKETNKNNEQTVSQPNYLKLAPPRVDFWESSADGERISPLGCLPLTVAATQEHHTAVLATQIDLRDLNMLHQLDETDVDKIIQQLRSLQTVSTQFHLVRLLIEGLAQNTVVVHKGLSTGFTVPDTSVEFWGLAAAARDDQSSVDIFLSRRSPDDASTVLHVWLAHNGVSRVHRLEEELRLEAAYSPTKSHTSLPLSIRAAIDRATPAETLFFLEQLQVASPRHRFKRAIESHCKFVLIDEVSVEAWNDAHCRQFLDSSLDMRRLLERRFAELARMGSTHLPSVESVLELHAEAEQLIADSLLFGKSQTLDRIYDTLLQAYDPLDAFHDCDSVDVNADILALLFFCTLRKAALEDVYLEATDRCPIFSQPDQAAVFCELWVLGSQCELYFGMVPRALGQVIYDKHKSFLREYPPPMALSDGEAGLMTVYAKIEPKHERADSDFNSKNRKGMKFQQVLIGFRALSVFCLPAMLDIFLLTFVGRGLFMTAYMSDDNIIAACYALLVALLLSAGITGSVGSVGNYYLSHYAYGNMVHFHAQCLSGGFVLSLLIAALGGPLFYLKTSFGSAMIFAAYHVLISTYLNLFGTLATMHQLGSPLTSGRTILWRTIPVLFVSPAVSSFVNRYDVTIYLSVGYTFLCLLLLQYRNVCRKWVGWTDNIPKLSERDIFDWYALRTDKPFVSDDTSESESSLMILDEGPTACPKQEALQTFRECLQLYRGNVASMKQRILSPDPLLERVDKGLPYIEWLLRKGTSDVERSELFSVSWFAQLSQALRAQQSMTQGLKEHSIFQLSRYATLDVILSIGLFLACLMDRWVSIAMSVSSPPVDLFFHFTSRYAICFAMLYFCTSVMILDATLQGYWSVSYELPDGKLSGLRDAALVTHSWERCRRAKYFESLSLLFSRLMIAFGVSSLLMWALVNNSATIKLYYLYTLAYTAIIIFQFNRCFTRNLASHAASIIASAVIGFLTGCILHNIVTKDSRYFIDIIALDTTAIIAAVLTCIWALRTPYNTKLETLPQLPQPKLWRQPRLGIAQDQLFTRPPVTEPETLGMLVTADSSPILTAKISETLQAGVKVLQENQDVFGLNVNVSRVSLTMWENGCIQLRICSALSFVDHGLETTRSFSRFQEGVLSITTAVQGMVPDLSEPQDINNSLVVESILYHTAVSVLSLSSAEATRTTLLIHRDLPSRIDTELAAEGARQARLIRSRANSQLLHHLCLGLDVDKDWSQLPHAIREAVFCRILDKEVHLSREARSWISSNGTCPHTSNFHVSLWLGLYEAASRRPRWSDIRRSDAASCLQEYTQSVNHVHQPTSVWQYCINTVCIPMLLFKWIGIISGGNSNVERELWHQLLCFSRMRNLVTWPALSIWRVCRQLKNIWIYVILIQHHNPLAYILRLAQKGVSRTLQKDRIVVQMRRKIVTGFASMAEQGSLTLDVFDGNHACRPSDVKQVMVATYDDQFRLASRCDEKKSSRVNSTYIYAEERNSRQPICKLVSTEDDQKICEYDRKGRVFGGVIKIGDMEYSFRYFYRRGYRESNDVLKAEFKIPASPSKGSLIIYWGAPAAEDVLENLAWIPSDLVCRIVKNVGNQCYITTVSYRHKRDPVRETVLKEGNTVAAIPSSWAPTIFEHEELLQQRPHDTSFESDDLLYHHRRSQLKLVAKFCGRPLSWAAMMNPLVWQYLRRKTVYRCVPTWWLRTELWNHWQNSGTLDALAACWMDEKILRAEPLLRSYWSARGSGRLPAAKVFLDHHIEQISAAINMDKDVSEVCMLPIKTSDLYAMGLGRDANQMTTRPEDCFNDTKDRISVIFNDTGCWPDAPGGVSNCRRDLVDGHSTIRNHVLAESANEYGIPRFQVERNVQSLKTLPLWGLDGRVPNHGLIENLLESEVDEKISSTATERDIVGVFVPLLKLFVKGARSQSISRSDMVTYSNAVLGMFDYFQLKDYNRTWNSKEVSNAWVEAWLTPFDDPNITGPTDCFELQRPTLSDLRSALEIFSSYFFIFSVQTPEDCPQVFQSTHHGVSSLFGVFLKHRRGATFGIWDHAILWRECCLNLSTAQSTLPIPVQSMVLAGIGLAMRLAYFHADVVLPCTPVFNPIWEAELGTDRGRLGHKKQFGRKIDPIVNGVSNMTAFKPVDEVRSTTPTVVMLSNVQFIKDIKTAILAVDVIVNKWGFSEYQLLVYGARDREPSYDIDMAKLIESCKLTNHVILKGFGKPQEALENAWLFMNSSLSEGLPLAIAEAALAGVPIVATAVGATALVLTDPDDPSLRYGEVVPPNDPTALARAQISILAMAGPWAKFAGDVDKRGSVLPHLRVPDAVTARDVEWLSKRMRDKAEDRRKLGLLGRQVVLRGFHGKRYLREHEQMYWVQWHLAEMRKKSSVEKSLVSAAGSTSGQGCSGTQANPGTSVSNGRRDPATSSTPARWPRKLRKLRRGGSQSSRKDVV